MDILDITIPSAARPGDPLVDIDTPALLLDLDAFERNVNRMQVHADAAGVSLRPHAKAHKTPAISLVQVQRGAVGICCQKISEALPFLQSGITDIHISNEAVSAVKLQLLARMARYGIFSISVDHAAQVNALSAAAEAHGSRIDVLVELDIGQNRCGVSSSEQVLRLLDEIARHPRLTFRGLQAYHGSIQHIRNQEDRRAAAMRAAGRTAQAIQDLEHAGVTCSVVTGGGTGSVEFDVASGVYTEVQPGSYVFMDSDYGRNACSGALEFEHSLFIATSVMSACDERSDQVVVDAGLKSIAVDSGMPVVWRDGAYDQELNYAVANDEHGIVHVRASKNTGRPALGDQLLLVPGHCDPTLNLHDEIIGFRGQHVETVWQVTARGLSR